MGHDGHRKRLALGLAGLAFGYAVMAFPDALGVIADEFKLDGVASPLFFAGFALCALPAGFLCGRRGARAVAASALVLTLPALALLAVGGTRLWTACAGLALMGVSNVVLQVALPVRTVELLGVARQPGVLTAGLFVKTLSAIALPFAVASCVSRGRLPLFFLAFGLLCAGTAALVLAGERGQDTTGSVTALRDVRTVLSDPSVTLAVLAFATAIVADVAFNLSVPSAVRMRFVPDALAVGVVYTVLFGVKLPVTLAGAGLFARTDARRLFPVSILLAATGALVWSRADGAATYLVGVALFAAGYANVYGFVFAVASARQQPEKASAVAALLTMAIAGGALASPLAAALGMRGAEKLAVAATFVLLALSIGTLFASRSRT